jgi:NUMOD1 domain
MEKDTAVNRIVRDMRMGGIICEDCIGEVRKYVDLAWVAGYENGRHIEFGHGSKRIGQYDKNGNLLNIFGSQKEAARKTGFTANGIYKAMMNGRRTKQGWTWKYIEDENNG